MNARLVWLVEGVAACASRECPRVEGTPPIGARPPIGAMLRGRPGQRPTKLRAEEAS
jgi:hypothetical protein